MSDTPGREALAADEAKLLRNLLDNGGTLPDRPVLRRSGPAARSLMRKGLIEAVKPNVPYLPYIRLTETGHEKALAALDAPPEGDG